MYFTGNPGGVGHNWFKRLFVKGRYEENEDPDDYVFIPATIDDNTVLMKSNPEYVKVTRVNTELTGVIFLYRKALTDFV